MVERPSHLIKELLENAFDAGALDVTVDFSQGGRFVTVSDNGEGIAKEDLPLALTRHATSKIRQTEDLSRLKSYGFRGEALASIASVSDLTLISGQKGQEVWRLQKTFGKESRIEPAGDSPGTKVIVRSLFQNLPARLKFMKSEGAENSSIKNMLKAMALSRPSVSFRVLHKGRLLFYWPAAKGLLDRACQVLSVQKSELYQTESEKGAFRLKALVGAPHNTFRNRRSSWFFVCGRWVDSPVLHAALMSAYRGLLMHGEYPLAVISLDGPGDEIDANIHPAKSQIRFKDSSFVFKAVEEPVRRLLEQAPWTKSITGGGRALLKEENLRLSRPGFNRTQFPLKRKDYSLSALAQMNPLSDLKGPLENEGLPGEAQKQDRLAGLEAGFRPGQTQGQEGVGAFAPAKASSWTSLQALAQAHLTYIVCQSDRALVFIDQHAAHERILYERLFHSWKKGGIEIQSHLIPLALDLEEGQAETLLGLKEDLKKLGVHLESLGPQVLAVGAAPSILKEKALKEGLALLARRQLETGDSFGFEAVVRDLCATMACHSAIRAGQALDEEQIKSLLAQMDEFPLSSFCPHGRPVFVEYPISRLERDFGRRT